MLKTIHAVYDHGNGKYLADVTLTIDGQDERCSYGVNPSDPAPVAIAIRAALARGDVSAQAKPSASKSELVAYAAKKRWKVETGGIAVNGIAVPTHDRSKLLILGGAQTLADDATTPFIANGVNHGSLTGAQFRVVNAAIVAHVQATFATLADVLTAIADGRITTVAGIDAAAWPKNG